jgi:acyl-CoA synthetase (AMP-forming)/AMP-acid ligase II
VRLQRPPDRGSNKQAFGCHVRFVPRRSTAKEGDGITSGAPNVDDSSHPSPGRRGALRRTRTVAGALRPLHVYERLEGLAAIAAATTPALASPRSLVRASPELWRWRANPAGVVVAGARKHPALAAVVDDDEVVTSEALEHRTNALARALLARGVAQGATLGILSHNRALVLEAGTAANKVGAHVVYLNSGFSPPQVRDVVAREGIDLVVCDGPLGAALAGVDAGPLLDADAVRAAHVELDTGSLEPPAGVGRVVVLTSGTTGTPKGARRAGTGSPLDAATILTCIPFTAGETTVVATPLFHGLGLFTANLALALDATLVLRERFSPEQVLQDVQDHRAVVLVAVPVMLQRILALPRRTLDRYDASSLRIVVSGGAALPAELSERFMDRFGEVLYNVYGSTETALATIASPADLRRAPGTAGHATPGVSVRIVDEAGRRVRRGATGRILVGSHLSFDGYTGGGGKDVVGGHMATGDLGHQDRCGRLFVDGREDEMVVSGGENVFPAEVEELLATHRGVLEAAVVGVPDEDYGHRLTAYVVRAPGPEVDEETLKRFVHDRLARFKTPREVVFLERLPRTATGKVLKRKLP